VTVETEADTRGRRYAIVSCACGSAGKRVQVSDLISGAVTACGCRMNAGTHGKDGTQVYRCWGNVRQRITNPNAVNFGRYGGRGLDIDPRWLTSFEAFYADMGDPPSPVHSIERKDNDRGYWPDNCCWATRAEQAANTRLTRTRRP
jgi:hypothetical protein